jgi:hypothetical protein
MLLAAARIFVMAEKARRVAAGLGIPAGILIVLFVWS